MYRRLQKTCNNCRGRKVHIRLQKVFQNFKVGGTELGEQNITEGFLKNFKVGGNDLSAMTPGREK